MHQQPDSALPSRSTEPKPGKPWQVRAALCHAATNPPCLPCQYLIGLIDTMNPGGRPCSRAEGPHCQPRTNREFPSRKVLALNGELWQRAGPERLAVTSSTNLCAKPSVPCPNRERTVRWMRSEVVALHDPVGTDRNCATRSVCGELREVGIAPGRARTRVPFSRSTNAVADGGPSALRVAGAAVGTADNGRDEGSGTVKQPRACRRLSGLPGLARELGRCEPVCVKGRVTNAFTLFETHPVRSASPSRCRQRRRPRDHCAVPARTAVQLLQAWAFAVPKVDDAHGQGPVPSPPSHDCHHREAADGHVFEPARLRAAGRT